MVIEEEEDDIAVQKELEESLDLHKAPEVEDLEKSLRFQIEVNIFWSNLKFPGNVIGDNYCCCCMPF